MAITRPTKDEIKAALGRGVPDVIVPDLKVLFCGINPGLYSAAVGHNFARPGNRFWKTLHDAGFTPRLLSPFEETELLRFGYGITNLVERGTAHADDLEKEELRAGVVRLAKKVKKYRPGYLAVLGIGAYRQAFGRPRAGLGLQKETIGRSKIWVLPNPSGINASYQLNDLRRMFRDLLEGSEVTEDLP